jgi:hypothetical protein
VTIRRRQAAAGACHTCSHPCRGALEPLPERDAQLWPHRPLSCLPGGHSASPGAPPRTPRPVPPAVRAGGPDRKERDLIRPASADEKLRVTRLPLNVISVQLNTPDGGAAARQAERVRG